MSEPETPQPLTRAEFEAGVKFYYSPHLKKFDDIDTYRKVKKEIHHKGKFYCHIQFTDDQGFVFIHYLFGHSNEFKVFFNNCYKSPYK
jgi:hypothetical protein